MTVQLYCVWSCEWGMTGPGQRIMTAVLEQCCDKGQYQCMTVVL